MNLININVPVLGESVTEATVAKWLKKVGDAVIMDEILVELETDKVTLEITAPSSGVLAHMTAGKGTVVQIGAILGDIDSEAVVETPAATPLPAATEKSASSATITRIVTKIEPVLSPNTKKMAEEASYLSPAVRKHLGDNQLDATDVHASRLDGRLTKADVLNHVNDGDKKNASAAIIETNADVNPLELSSRSNHVVSPSDDRLEVRVPLSRLRLRVAERLKYAQNTAAILTTFNEIDMIAVKQLRDRYKDVFEKKYGIKLGFMSFFVKACVQALKEIPMVNSRIEGDEIVTNNYCDIGVAVSAPTGLVVPIIRDAELLDLAGIERAVASYGKKAKDGKLTMEEMSGGTFTISNGGVFGSLFSTPIINPPQSAILGMHKIQDRPMAVNGRVEIRPMMYVALSYDHRLIDGREAVTFLATIKDCVENPGRFLLEL
ncbi:MAG: 2-oxoglutarate dehydrogenase complex dihydrolipoyllysine-residue succinyltransferase [Pseudomonadota bacterium]